ncbi:MULTISPECIES: NAD-dependent epimerase/dehydratase family protein [unclassified Streptomyces]|uniref:NAD-dependent epimerase/dehydratase family protein n=1 Tax=unclassified Streptomyces TaxID=2593676 RepID=UPI00093F6D64|nr:GDP-mannose 4,6-dehydratase [Streptomyces sp. TSRI0281]OKI40723.1 hypothetical protein A6A29_38680 [Streptomyces sp. TSRI0281]
MTSPTPLAGRPVVVTGAGGFLGSHVVEALLQRGARVRALVRYTSGKNPGWLAHIDNPDLELVYGDVRDRECATALVKGAEIVFHLASLISVPHSYEQPEAHLTTNVHGTHNLLAACRDLPLDRFVYISSSEVYGSAQYEPIDERHPLVSQSPYAASKIAAEKLCESFSCSFGVPVTVVRPFNLYGPRQSTRAVIPSIISQALSSPVLHMGDTSTRRDFNYVTDTARALVELACCPGAENEVVNIGTGQARSIDETIVLIGELLGTELVVRRDPARMRPQRSEVTLLRADSSKLHGLVGPFSPTPFETGLARVIENVSGRDLHGVYDV